MITQLLEKGLIPDSIIRLQIRKLLKDRIQEISQNSPMAQQEYLNCFLEDIRKLDNLAIKTGEANEQHYEVPTKFYQYVLGDYLKYSCAYFNDNNETLTQAEENMLKMYETKLELKDGMEILELGCGWGSATLFLGEKYPNVKITAVSNSSTQKKYIDDRAKEKGIKNITIITEDINKLELNRKFDRIYSIEMFEHVRNYYGLFRNLNSWLKPEGHGFIHVFVHKNAPYFFDVNDDSDWMSKYFFSGGVMPSEKLFYHINDHIRITGQTNINGKHYSLTSRKWLENMDLNKEKIMQLFNEHYGKQQALKWFEYWRIFFMACEELWGFKDGTEWFVSHYTFKKVLTQ